MESELRRAALQGLPVSTTRSFEVAKQAVEGWLDLGRFINNHKTQICERLEACERSAQKAKVDADLTFFAEGLPAIDSIIRVGSSRARLNSVTRRIRKDLPDRDPLTFLSLLMFRYIVGKRRELLGTSINNEEKRKVWEEIARRVESLQT